MLQVHDKLLGMICDTQYHISRSQIMLKKSPSDLGLNLGWEDFSFVFFSISKGSHEIKVKCQNQGVIQQLRGPNFIPDFNSLPSWVDNCGHFTYYQSFLHVTKRRLSIDPLPTSFFLSSYWMTPTCTAYLGSWPIMV